MGLRMRSGKRTAFGVLLLSFSLCATLPIVHISIGKRLENDLHNPSRDGSRPSGESGMGMSGPENPVSRNSGNREGNNPAAEDFSAPQLLTHTGYTVVRGDTIGEIAQLNNLNQDTLLSFNEIKNSRLLQIGQKLNIPNQDGILYLVKKGDTLSSIAEAHQAEESIILHVNSISGEAVVLGKKLFLPGARLPSVSLQEINGDLFIWPVRGYVSSPYGYRTSPFTGARQFHSGLDIGATQGTPIKAAMSGRVSAIGYDVNSGNYIMISHHSGYRTFYGHLDVVRVAAGAQVKTGERIGDVGSTGLSTGSHLHFSVYKNGVTLNPRILMK